MAGAWARSEKYSGVQSKDLKREGKGGRSPYMIPLPLAGNAGYAQAPFTDSFHSDPMKYLYFF